MKDYIPITSKEVLQKMKKYIVPITADEALRNANQYNENIVKNITNDITERIRAASDNGKYSISIRCFGGIYDNINDDKICSEIIGYFLKNGFSVIKTYDYKTMILKIEWNKQNNNN